jgi:hypothetical protein
MPIAYDLGVLHMADSVEELEEIALGRVERQIADVKTRRSDFDRFRFAGRPLRPFRSLRSLRAIVLCLGVLRLKRTVT